MIARSLRAPIALVTTLAAVGALAGCSSTPSGGD